jgi:high-affinity iron transporter
MGATFVITLREGFEAALLLGIVYASLHRVGRREHARMVTVGAALGLLASIAMGIAVATLNGPLADLGPDVVALGVIAMAVALLTWHAWWMSGHARGIRPDVERRVALAEAGQRLWPLALIAFTGVVREGAETVLFLWGLMSQVSGASGAAGLVGGVTGLGAAALLGWLVFRGGTKICLARFFTVTSVLLALLSAGLVATGVGRVQGLGWLPQSSPIWDTSWLLDDHGAIGGVLAGLVGYRAAPTAPEVAAYVTYLAFAVALFGPRRQHAGASAVTTA